MRQCCLAWEARERFLSLRLLHSTAAIIDACCDAWMRLVAETDRIKSLCSYPWIEKVASHARRYDIGGIRALGSNTVLSIVLLVAAACLVTVEIRLPAIFLVVAELLRGRARA
jgi:hypothetical protein